VKKWVNFRHRWDRMWRTLERKSKNSLLNLVCCLITSLFVMVYIAMHVEHIAMWSMLLYKYTFIHRVLILSLRFNRHFPGEPGLASVYWSKGWWRWWWQLDYWSYKLCKAPVKSSPPTNQHQFFTGRMPFLLPNQHCQSTEWTNSYTVLHNIVHVLRKGPHGSIYGFHIASDTLWLRVTKFSTIIHSVFRELIAPTKGD